MDGLATLSRHRKIARIVMLFLMGVVVMLRWLGSSLFGLLVAALLAYSLSGALFDVTPLRPSEVVAWAASQDPQVILAAAGILGAYWIAARTWKDQKRIELQLDALTHILTFFESARADALRLEVFVDRLNALQSTLAGSATQHLVRGNALWVLQQSPEMAAARLRLSDKSVEVHTLRSRYELILSQRLSTSFAFDHAAKSLEQITDAMWFPIPAAATNMTELTQQIVHFDARPWAHFVRASDHARTQMDAAVGGLAGLVHGKLFGPTLGGLVRFAKTSRALMADRKADA